MALPKLPKLFDSGGVKDVPSLASRVFEWCSAAQDLLKALRAAVVDLQVNGGGGGSVAEVTFAAPVGLTVGGSNVTGSGTTVPHANHEHALPAFGSTAGTIMQGNATPGGPPTGAAGGELGGTYPNPTVNHGTAANTACAGNDTRLSDARTPTGAAGGALTGTYPNPTLLVSAASVGKLIALGRGFPGV